MDSMEVNKLVGAVVGALLVYLGANFFAELYYEGSGGHGEAHYAYAIDTDAGEAEAAPEETVDMMALMASADPAKGEKVFNKCKACHKLEPGANGTGPTLHGVVGRPIGQEAGFGFSGALAEMDGAWDVEALSSFLENPKGFAPGTKMSFAGLKKPEDRADVIAYLESVGN